MGIVDCCKFASDSMLAATNGRPDLVHAMEAVHALLNEAASKLGAMVDEDRARQQLPGSVD